MGVAQLLHAQRFLHKRPLGVHGPAQVDLLLGAQAVAREGGGVRMPSERQPYLWNDLQPW